MQEITIFMFPVMLSIIQDILISPFGTFELGCATNKTDTAER
jgi:hypothetical protein